jgi:hypothetical protein
MLGMVESGFIVPTLGEEVAVLGRGKNLVFIFLYVDITFYVIVTN